VRGARAHVHRHAAIIGPRLTAAPAGHRSIPSLDVARVMVRAVERPSGQVCAQRRTDLRTVA
jgi:hypothetical protein